MATIRIFVSYAHEDKRWLEPENDPYVLIPFLQESLRREDVFFWYDKHLIPRENSPLTSWRKSIKPRLPFCW